MLLSRVCRQGAWIPRGTSALFLSPAAACPTHPVASHSTRTPSVHASTIASGSSPSLDNPSTSSSWSSELVTRTVLQVTAAALAAGLPPQGVSDLISSPDPGPHAVGDLDGPTCRQCTVRALSGEAAEALSDLVLGMGAQSVVVQEHCPPGSTEQKIYSDGTETPLWDLCDVQVYFALEDDPARVLGSASEVLLDAGYLTAAQPSLQFEIEDMVNQQWVDQIKASYVPIKISERLYIVPEWSEPEDPAAVNILLQPGVAFGTGEHPTTRLCLLALEALAGVGRLRGAAVMDYGCGSGVLALAALQLGAASAVGADTDGLAVRAARRNAQLNAAQERFAVFECGPSLDDQEPMAQAGLPKLQFDVVAANILRGPLVELRPRLTEYCAPGGQLLLSGILNEQAPEIVQAYSQDFEDFKVHSDGSWACIQAVRVTGAAGKPEP